MTAKRTNWLLRMSLPLNQAATSVMFTRESLRRVNSTSLVSICTGTLYSLLVTPGLSGETSVGPGTASSSANRLVFEDSLGIALATRLFGSRLKYGTP